MSSTVTASREASGSRRLNRLVLLLSARSDLTRNTAFCGGRIPIGAMRRATADSTCKSNRYRFRDPFLVVSTGSFSRLSRRFHGSHWNLPYARPAMHCVDRRFEVGLLFAPPALALFFPERWLRNVFITLKSRAGACSH